MQVSFHIGAHYTDDQKILRSMLKNKEALLEQGIVIPGPSRYREVLNSARHRIDRGENPFDVRDDILDIALDGQDAKRIVLSTAAFLSGPRWIFKSGELYGDAAIPASAYARIFAKDELSIHMGICNLATFVPKAFRDAKQPNFEEYIQKLKLRGDSWMQVISKIRAVAKDAQITVWCNEDTPLIWSQLIREISGVSPDTVIAGGFDLVSEIMSREGMRRMLTYMKEKPPHNEAQKRRILIAFMNKYAMEDVMTEELDLPGWDDDTIQQLTLAYEEDVSLIENISDVRLIAP